MNKEKQIKKMATSIQIETTAQMYAIAEALAVKFEHKKEKEIKETESEEQIGGM